MRQTPAGSATSLLHATTCGRATCHLRLTSGRERVLPMRPVLLTLAASFVAAVGGCARYEYALLQVPPGPERPAGMTRPSAEATGAETPRAAEVLTEVVSADREVVVERLPLRYRFQVVENRLVLRVFNASPRRLELVGGSSVVVDPSGQSHPLQRVAMPSGAFAKLVLPPLRPPPEPRDGPFVHGQGGFGPGLDRSDFGLSFGYSISDPPQPAGPPRGWTWPGEGTVRLSLVFRDLDTGENLSDLFVIGRRRAP